MQFVPPVGQATPGMPETSQFRPTFAQHGMVSEHVWPACGQVLEPEPEPVLPPQVPKVWPGVNTHVRPVQQSPLLVHMPVVLTQPPPQ